LHFLLGLLTARKKSWVGKIEEKEEDLFSVGI
jgi:hypothetical protein